jgi:hypothetical protein
MLFLVFTNFGEDAILQETALKTDFIPHSPLTYKQKATIMVSEN